MSTTWVGLVSFLVHADSTKTHSLNVHHRPILIVNKLCSKLRALLRIGAHDVLQKTYVVGRVSNFLRIQYNLVCLSSFRKTGDDFIWDICAQVNAECKSEIVEANDVTKLLAAGKLETRELVKNI